jgi:hypothetical protein
VLLLASSRAVLIASGFCEILLVVLVVVTVSIERKVRAVLGTGTGIVTIATANAPLGILLAALF